MRSSIISVVILLFLSCSSSELENNKSSGIYPFEIHQKTLDNGLNIVAVPFESPGIVSFYIVVRVGAREEVEPGKTGFAHFFEHMMFRGTDKYPTEDYRKVLKSIGASANANTSPDRTLYYMTGNAELLEKMFEIEADRFINLNYSVHDFKTEAGAVKGEYTLSHGKPPMQLRVKTLDVAFGKHTYKHTTLGYWDDIVDMPNQYEYSLKFFDRFYRPEYTTVLVVGDILPKTVYDYAKRYFGSWEKGSYIPEIPVEPEQKETRYAHITAKNYPPVLQLNYKSPGVGADMNELAALDILGFILFGKRSTLHKKLVIEERICRSLKNRFGFTKDPFLFLIGAGLYKEEDMQLVKDEIINTIDDFVEHGIDEKRLNDDKSALKYWLATSLDNPESIAKELSTSIWLTGDPTALEEIWGKADSLTMEYIQFVAKKYLVPEHLTISTISPKEEGEVL